MDYFHTDDPTTLAYLSAVIETAIEHGQGVCIEARENFIQLKRGGSGWSGPIEGTPHISRDTAPVVV
jgi:hypothetical protein